MLQVLYKGKEKWNEVVRGGGIVQGCLSTCLGVCPIYQKNRREEGNLSWHLEANTFTNRTRTKSKKFLIFYLKCSAVAAINAKLYIFTRGNRFFF